MKEMPNIELSIEEIDDLRKNASQKGSGREAGVYEFQKFQGRRSVIKLYYPRVISPYGTKSYGYTKTMNNKYLKIKHLYQEKKLREMNDIQILASVSCQDKHVAYVMTDSDYAEINELTTRKEIIKYLSAAKEKIVSFEKIGILYGDCSVNNIMVRNGDVCFADLDNVQYQTYPMDLMRCELREFIGLYGKFDEKAVAYMYNILTYKLLCSDPDAIIRDVADWIAQINLRQFEYPYYRKIKDEMVHITPKYSGEYLMDYVKEKYR